MTTPTALEMLCRVLVPVALAVPLTGQGSLAERYREPAERILGAALVDTDGWDKLEHLTTHIGHRLSGSKALEDAIGWAVEGMRTEGRRSTL